MISSTQIGENYQCHHFLPHDSKSVRVFLNFWCHHFVSHNSIPELLISSFLISRLKVVKLIEYSFESCTSFNVDRDGWHKSMSHFASMCCSSPQTPQVIFYDGHDRYFDDRALNILCRHNIQYFILKSGGSVHDQPNDNGPNTDINDVYGNARINWMRHHGTLNFTPPHMNYLLVETWEALKLSSKTITQKYFKKTHWLPLSPLDIGTNHQAFLAGTQQSNIDKTDEIGNIGYRNMTTN